MRKLFFLSLGFLLLACSSGSNSKKPYESSRVVDHHIKRLFVKPVRTNLSAGAEQNYLVQVQIDEGIVMNLLTQNFQNLEGWNTDDHSAALNSFKVSCTEILRRNSTNPMSGIGGEISDWEPVCRKAQQVSPQSAKYFFEQEFKPVEIEPDSDSLFTAYYEPVIKGSRTRTNEYKYPLYRKPPELKKTANGTGIIDASGKFRPYYTRGQIAAGALKNRNLEIAYLSDPVESFFLHIQGSGRIVLPDGNTIRMGYAGKNGHSYTSVAKKMAEWGIVSINQASAGTIKKWVRKNPKDGRHLLNQNKSYVFFREITGIPDSLGPVGAMQIPITPMRSIAVDRKYHPLGAPIWLDINSPIGALQRLVVAQDVGAAIKGPQRADVFWGTGSEAGRIAGQMKHTGRMITLLPNALAYRLTGIGG